MTDDLVPVTPPSAERDPDVEVVAPDGTALVWAPERHRARGGLWNAITRHGDAEPVEVIWCRPATGPAWYLCADCGQTSSRTACPHVLAATRAAEVFQQNGEPS
jgi:hypothetical protein